MKLNYDFSPSKPTTTQIIGWEIFAKKEWRFKMEGTFFLPPVPLIFFLPSLHRPEFFRTYPTPNPPTSWRISPKKETKKGSVKRR